MIKQPVQSGMGFGAGSSSNVSVSYARTPSPATEVPDAATVANSIAEIDSALLSAVSNPRERMVLLQIEQSILTFMESK
jgi:hypothetical protein